VLVCLFSPSVFQRRVQHSGVRIWSWVSAPGVWWPDLVLVYPFLLPPTPPLVVGCPVFHGASSIPVGLRWRICTIAVGWVTVRQFLASPLPVARWLACGGGSLWVVVSRRAVPLVLRRGEVQGPLHDDRSRLRGGGCAVWRGPAGKSNLGRLGS
jgi:hypothetical protein